MAALLVMEHCSLGSLHRAIAAGRFFLDRRRRLPNLVGGGGAAACGNQPGASLVLLHATHSHGQACVIPGHPE